MKKNVFSRNFLDSQVKTVGYIIYATRMEAGLGQVEVAKKLNVTQSYLSKMEAGLMAPSLFFWFDFCETFNIDKDAITSGYLGGLKLTEVKHSKAENGFKLISKEYQPNRCMKTRQMLPFLNGLAQFKSGDFVDDFLKDNFIHSSFFLNLDNQLNLKMANDIIIEGSKVIALKNDKIYSYLNEHLTGFLPENRKVDNWDKFVVKLTSFQKIFNFNFESSKSDLELCITVNEDIRNDFFNSDEKTVNYFEKINIDLIPNHFDHSLVNLKSKKKGSFVDGDKEIHFSLAI